MKKIGIWFLTGLICLIIFIIFNYYWYSKVTNDFVNSVVALVLDNYENVDSAELINVINNSNGKKTDVLEKFGFVKSDISYLKDMQDTYYKILFIGIGMFLLLSALIILFAIYKKRKRNKEILKLTNYLKKINEGIYDLEILDNTEGELSILKNEIYKTTICLKESVENLKREKLIIKENLANISHQLKTPLTSIMIMLDTLLEEDVPIYKQKEFLRDSRDQIENINFLIIVLLKLSRFDANVVEFKKEVINVKKLLMECIKNVDVLREINGVNIHLKGSDKVTFQGDFKWEVEALTNIIKNAIEHSENSNVYIIYEDNSIYVKISIIDEGTGIKEKDLKHIFDRFYKSNNSPNNFGIGLSLASEIINKDNGKIDVKNNEKKGSSFIIKYYK